jgi:Flp pilus assembly protein TadD
VVTINQAWRGKPVVEMAAQNAKKLRSRLEKQQNNEVMLTELNFRGVSAVNRNDLKSADQDFRSAYALDPNDAFALNNIGYLAELQGDQETAEFFYSRAKEVAGANTKVGFATRHSAEGLPLSQVANDSDSRLEALVSQEREALRRQHEPIGLRRRDNSLVVEPSRPPE